MAKTSRALLDSYSDQQIIDACAKASSKKTLMQLLNISNTVDNHRRLKERINRLNVNVYGAAVPRVYKTVSAFNNESHLRVVVEQSHCYAEVLRTMGIAYAGANLKTLRKYIQKFDISTQYFSLTQMHRKRGGLSTYTNEQLFVKDSKVDKGIVKNRILKEELIPYVCACCKNEGMWCGRPLVLQLEHKNGVNNDHRLENLEFLCPNCHTQTSTWGGKNIVKKVEEQRREKRSIVLYSLEKKVEEILSVVLSKCNCVEDILKHYGMTLNTRNRAGVVNLLRTQNDPRVEAFWVRQRKAAPSGTIEYPPLEELLEQLKNSTYVALAKRYGCSDNALRKYIQRECKKNEKKT